MAHKRAVLAALAVVLLGAGGLAFLPWTANHFGYALPGDRGLPYRIHHAGRDYRSYATCAGAGWCHDEPYCVPRHDLALTAVDEVGTWFGPSHVVYTAERSDGTPVGLLVEAAPDCYVGYVMMGGP
ncbi:hypothetical protein ACIRSS_27555 [Amycolatopsis sp. NPDC101161]|uniref:hypothetical protein n=1 Tax=Amycolatopsis sp. NPDC101161 TaxID=3363940 RepID=UPI003826C382